jgi:hypothetical protein
VEAPVKAPAWPWLRYGLGRLLQVTGLVVTLVAATAFFGTPSIVAMLRMMLVGVLIFIPGWLLGARPGNAEDGLLKRCFGRRKYRS